MLDSPEINGRANCIQTVPKTDTQVRLGKSKDSIGEDRERKEKEKREERGSEGTIKWSSTPLELNGLSLDKPDDKHPPHPSYKNHFDFDIVENQIQISYEKVLQEQERYPYSLQEVSEILKCYFTNYQRHVGKPHPHLRNDSIWAVISELPNCFNDYEEPIDLTVDTYETIIKKHFETDYQGRSDYNILHFMSGQIRALRYYELSC